MATTTTNYGFDVPQSSDLVKNGATQIALLGQDLDTFLFRPFTVNSVLNSSFNVWQRGTSITNGGYSADRWQAYGNGNGTVSRQATGDTTNLPNIQYCGRSQRTAASADTNPLYLAQNFETVNSIPFAGKGVTLSFYARKGANYSPTSSLLNIALQTGTGTDQAFTGYTGTAYPINSTVTLTTTWQRFTLTGTLSSALTELAIVFVANVTGTAGAADYFEVTGVQLEVGNQATPYTPATPTYATELAACQRYYTRVLASSGGNYYYYALGTAKTSTVAKMVYEMPVTMRVAPSAPEYSGLSLYDATNAAIAVTAVTSDTPTLNNFAMDITVASGLTQYRPYYLFANNQSGGYFGLTAEL
jgi:hypothetical protein